MAKQITIEFDDLDPRENAEDKAEQSAKKEAENIKKQLKKKGGGRRSLKEPVDKEIALPDDEELFKKMYYPIGEVAKMFGEQTSLIRYWDNEFKVLKPRKNRKGDRYFRPEDVKTLYLIHDLLRVRKFTIEGAKEFLRNDKAARDKFELTESLEKLKLFLQQLKDNL